MARLESLSGVGIFTRNLKRSVEFYTKRVGLQVREYNREWSFASLGATKAGVDANLGVWQPVRSWGESYEDGMAQIGTVSGVGFTARNLDKTVGAWKRRRVKVEMEDESDEPFARFFDPDRNVLFAFQPSKKAAGPGGLRALDFVTVVSKDRQRAGAFFTKALGMKTDGKVGEYFASYRLRRGGTAIMPFSPQRRYYDTLAEYKEDLAHLGEKTYIGFDTSDLVALQEELMRRGVRFTRKAERQEWGGWKANFLDPDDNEYAIFQQPR